MTWSVFNNYYRRKFWSQTSDNMDRWKAESGRGREKRKIRREKSRRERVRRKKMQMREKVGKSRNTLFFQWFVAPESRKVGSLKGGCGASWPDERWKVARRCGAKHVSKSKCTKHLSLGPLLEVEMSKKCMPLWREAHFQVKSVKNWRSRTTFGSCDVEKVHAVVARSTFPSQNVQNTRGSDHFWRFRCRKSARRCGAKHISKLKCTKLYMFAPLLEVQMSKKCTPLWREAHFQVKMYKAPQLRTAFGSWDVEKVHAVVARSTFPNQNVQNTGGSDHFWKLRCRKSARRCGAKHISKSKCAKHTILGPLLEVEMLKKCTPFWREAHVQVKMYKAPHVRATFGRLDIEKVHALVARSTFPSQNVESTTCLRHFWRFRCRFAASRHYTTGHYTTLQYTTLHYTTLHYTTLHYTTLHYTTLQLQLHNYTPLRSTTLNYTTLHYITLHSATLHYITLHCTTFHYTSLHYTPLHYTTTTTTTTQLHSTTLHYTPLH